MGDTMYFKHSEYGWLSKIVGGLAGKAYAWNEQKRQWVESEGEMRILDPNNDKSFWYDEISEAEAKKIMGQ